MHSKIESFLAGDTYAPRHLIAYEFALALAACPDTDPVVVAYYIADKFIAKVEAEQCGEMDRKNEVDDARIERAVTARLALTARAAT